MGDTFLRESDRPRPPRPSSAWAVSALFYGVFEVLRNSKEKSVNRVRNCLTALKTANIMPGGGRDCMLATLVDGRGLGSIRRELGWRQPVFAKLSAALAGQD